MRATKGTADSLAAQSCSPIPVCASQPGHRRVQGSARRGPPARSRPRSRLETLQEADARLPTHGLLPGSECVLGRARRLKRVTPESGRGATLPGHPGDGPISRRQLWSAHLCCVHRSCTGDLFLVL